MNHVSRPPQSFANLLAMNVSQQPQQYIRTSQSAPGTPTKLTGLTAVIRAQAPTTAAASRVPIIQQQLQQQPKVHLQAGQPAQPQQQSIVLPVRTTPLTTQGGANVAVTTATSYPATTQQLTTATLPSHPSGTIQTVKIGGGQAQVGFNLRNICRIL